MSRMIEVSEQDFARIQQAADADGMPLDAWVVANLPLDTPHAETADQPAARARTMADRLKERIVRRASAAGAPSSDDGADAMAPPSGQTLAERAAALGLLGVVNSGGAERLAERHSEVFGEMLEAERKAGRR